MLFRKANCEPKSNGAFYLHLDKHSVTEANEIFTVVNISGLDKSSLARARPLSNIIPMGVA